MPGWMMILIVCGAAVAGAVSGIVFTFYSLRYLLWKIIDILNKD